MTEERPQEKLPGSESPGSDQETGGDSPEREGGSLKQEQSYPSFSKGDTFSLDGNRATVKGIDTSGIVTYTIEGEEKTGPFAELAPSVSDYTNYREPIPEPHGVEEGVPVEESAEAAVDAEAGSTTTESPISADDVATQKAIEIAERLSPGHEDEPEQPGQTRSPEDASSEDTTGSGSADAPSNQPKTSPGVVGEVSNTSIQADIKGFAEGKKTAAALGVGYEKRLSFLAQELQKKQMNRAGGRNDMQINNEMTLIEKAKSEIELRGGDTSHFAQTKPEVKGWSTVDAESLATQLEGALTDVEKRSNVAFDSADKTLGKTFPALKRFEKKLARNAGDARNLADALAGVAKRTKNMKEAGQALDNTSRWNIYGVAKHATRAGWNQTLQLNSRVRAWESNQLLSQENTLMRGVIRLPRFVGVTLPLGATILAGSVFLAGLYAIFKFSGKVLKFADDPNYGGHGLFSSKK